MAEGRPTRAQDLPSHARSSAGAPALLWSWPPDCRSAMGGPGPRRRTPGASGTGGGLPPPPRGPLDCPFQSTSDLRLQQRLRANAWRPGAPPAALLRVPAADSPRPCSPPEPGAPAALTHPPTLPMCTTDAPASWDFGAAPHGGAAASQRPVTPGVGALSDGGRPARQAAARATTATPPAALKQPGFFRAAMRTTSGSLSGLLKRPGTAAPAPAGASPLFEVHGAAMLPPEPPTRPATAAPAAPQGRTAVQSQQHKVAAPAYNVHARAANSRPATATCASPPVVLSPHRQASPAAVASHGLDPSTSPVPQAAASIPHYQQPLRRPGVPVAPHAMASSAAAAPQQRQVSQQQQPAQREQQHAQGGAFSRASSLGSSAGSSSLPSTSGDYGSSSSQGGAPPAVMHQNPLYAGGSDSISFGGSRQQAAQPQARPPPVRVAPPAAATPATPPASVLAGMAGVSASPTPTSNLQVLRGEDSSNILTCEWLYMCCCCTWQSTACMSCSSGYRSPAACRRPPT